ncbi:MAG: hypothetical protein ACI92I_000642 [Acidimicrobiales bacterium]|jgi:hypothetical protein
MKKKGGNIYGIASVIVLVVIGIVLLGGGTYYYQTEIREHLESQEVLEYDYRGQEELNEVSIQEEIVQVQEGITESKPVMKESEVEVVQQPQVQQQVVPPVVTEPAFVSEPDTSTGNVGNSPSYIPPIQIETCVSNSAPVFTHDITDVSRIYQITPPGTIFSNDVVKSHSYLWIEDGKKVPVYAPVDMNLSSGSYSSNGTVAHFLLFFKVSCEVEVKFDHILEPVQAIRDVLPAEPALNDSRTSAPADKVFFKAGDLVGYTPGNPGSHNWDFGVYNTTLYPNPVTKGVANLAEIDKRADCAYDYFTTEKKNTYRDLFLTEIGGSSKAIKYCAD